MTCGRRRLGLGWLAMATLALCAWSATPSRAEEWRGWNIHPPDYPVSQAMERFGVLVTQRSGGRFRPRTYHDAQLGQQDEAVQQMRLGSIDFAEFNLSALNNLAPLTNVPTLPFLFRDVAHLHGVMDGPIGEEIARQVAGIGIVALAWYDAGARNLYTRRPVHTLADLRGMRIRIQTSQLWTDIIKAVGAVPRQLPFGDIQAALISGAIDGAENNWPTYESSQHVTIARYVLATEHSSVPEVLAISRSLWQRLNAADREMVEAAARESATYQRDLWAVSEASSRQRAIASGAEVTEITDKPAWQAAMAPLYARYTADPAAAAMVQRIRETP